MTSISSSSSHRSVPSTSVSGSANSVPSMNTTAAAVDDEATTSSDDPSLPTRQFYKFCLLLESIDKKRKNINKGQQIDEFFKAWRAESKTSLYPVIRLLLPQLDRQRGNYSLKEQKLAGAYVEALGLPSTSFNALKLERWKKKHDGQADDIAGDFSLVAWDVISKYAPGEVPEVHTISEVNNLLSGLATNNRDIPLRKKTFQTLVKHYTALENKWIIRIILKDLKIGVSENTVFPIYHPDALDYYNVCSNLKKTVDDCADETVRLTTSDIRLNQPFKPMLSKRVNNFKEVIECMGGQEFWIETKLDGERVQVHKEGDQYRYWSRKGNEYTHLYGANPSEGSLTPYIHPLINNLATSLILDGEMVEYDPATDAILPFGTVKTAGGNHTDDANKTRPCLVVFDILYMNGVSIIDQQLQLRWDMFEKLIEKPERGRLEVLAHRTGTREQDVIDAIDEAVMEREEGVIIKNPRSRYICNGRSKEWIKVKPEYVDSMSEELDLIIIGAKYGKGNRGNGIFATFLCAIRDDTVQPDADGNPQFLSFCRFGSGTSYQIIGELNQLFREHGRENTLRNQNPWVKFKSIAKVYPDYIIDPRVSKVVQIKASEIVISDSYEAEYTLRFPRFERFRPDKDYMSCMTKSQLFQLRRTMSGKLWNKKQPGVAGSGSGSIARAPRARASGPRKITQPYFLPSRVGTDTSKVQRVDDLFHGYMFFVLRGDEYHGKQDLETDIKRYGGSYTQSPTNASVLIAGAEGPNNALEGLKRCGDILLPTWVLDCIHEKRIIPFAPKYMLYTTEATKAKFRESMDQFEDSYTELLTLDALEEIMAKMPNRSEVLRKQRMEVVKYEAAESLTDPSHRGGGGGFVKLENVSTIDLGARYPHQSHLSQQFKRVKKEEPEEDDAAATRRHLLRKSGNPRSDFFIANDTILFTDAERRAEWERTLRIAERLSDKYSLFEDEETGGGGGGGTGMRDDRQLLGMFRGMKVVLVYPPWPMNYFIGQLQHQHRTVAPLSAAAATANAVDSSSLLAAKNEEQDSAEQDILRMAVKDSLSLVLDLWQKDQEAVLSASFATMDMEERQEAESNAESRLAGVLETMTKYEDVRRRLDLTKTLLEYHGAWVISVRGDGEASGAEERHVVLQELAQHNQRWEEEDDEDYDGNEGGGEKVGDEKTAKKRKRKEKRCPISHFVFHPDYLDALAWWNASRKGIRRVPHLVTMEWVTTSHTEGYRQPEEQFYPRA